MAIESQPVLAVYDFRSKQEFIYRTNRMREITGASELIAGMFGRFLSIRIGEMPIRDDWRDDSPEPLMSFKTREGQPVAAEVVYEGGGNLLLLFRSGDLLREANREFSRIVIERAYSLSMVHASVPWEESKDPEITNFEWNRTRAYQALDRAKRIDVANPPCNVLPYTQVDRLTFQPIVAKDDPIYGDVTQEGFLKQAAYSELPEARRSQGKLVDELGTQKGVDSLIAVLYFDGNSIGERLKSAVRDGIESGKDDVTSIRSFSKELHETLVERPEKAMIDALAHLPEEYQGYRVIIDHGDEITFICNAHAAPFALDAYFGALEGTGYHACGGMAICHSHDPFAEVYRIAEECCESGKKLNRKNQRAATAGLVGQALVEAARDADANYIDMHFCRAGITGSLERIREAQEGSLTALPYRVDGSYARFLRIGELLASSDGLKRTDLKQLSRAILQGHSWFVLEYERLRAKSLSTMLAIERECDVDALVASDKDLEKLKRCLFDVTSLYDVFAQRFGDADEVEANNGQEE